MKNIETFISAWCIVCYLFLFLSNPTFADTFTVTSSADSGPGSFRQAIIDAEANSPQIDRIVFDPTVFPPSGPQTITLLSTLPVISDPVEIDATNAGVELNGTNITGDETYGLNIIAGDSTIRGLIINRFRGSSGSSGGIFLGTKGGNVIQGNYIGTDSEGSSAMANYLGINIEASNGNTIGGSSQGEGNVISGNVNTGLRISGSDYNIVKGNFIGTDAAGTSGLSNGNQGMRIDNGDGNIVGGMDTGEGNVISSNYDVGVRIAYGYNNDVHGNTIGLDVSKTISLGNAKGGVHVFNGTGNSIRANAIYANGQLGIDLDVDGSDPPDGVTPNDPGDADAGSNNLQNFPVLTSATRNASASKVRGSLNSVASSSFTIEFFSNTSCDTLGYGEGQTFLSSISVVTDGNGDVVFNETLEPVEAGLFITATATDASNNTSEFSSCIEVVERPVPAMAPILTPLLLD